MRIEVLLDLKPDSAKARSGMSNSSVFGGWTASTGACSPATRRAARSRAGTCDRKLALSPCARAAKARWWRCRMAFICSDFASGELTLLHHPEADRPFNRLNDGKVDRQGRFLFGSMDMRGRGTERRAISPGPRSVPARAEERHLSSLTPPAGAPPARPSILPIPGRAKSAPGTTTPRPAIFPANGSFAMSIAAKKAARRTAPPWTAKAICGTRWSTPGKLVRYTPEGQGRSHH